MVINTKFDKSQLVWFIHENKIHKGTVYSLKLLIFSTQSETYGVTLGSDVIYFDKDDLFETKELLIESIQ